MKGSSPLRPASSDHYDGKRFFNPGLAPAKRSATALWRWMLIERRKLKPWTPAPAIAASRPPQRSQELLATWIGHATVLVQVAGLNILTDPVYSQTVSPIPRVGPRRAHPPGVVYADLPPIDMVLISHAHYDHLDDASIRALAADHDPLFIAGCGLARWLRRRGAKRVVTLDWWQSHTLTEDQRRNASPINITGVPAQHWSRRGLFDRNRTLWLGYVIETSAERVYFAGDTGFNQAMFEEIRRQTGMPDLALLPIGAYEPRRYMKRQHMNPAEAVAAFQTLQARRAMGIHFGTFRLTDEAREQPSIDLAAARRASDIDEQSFKAPAFGETIRGYS